MDLSIRPDAQSLQEMWEQAIADKAESFYRYLLADSWNCYASPDLYPARISSVVQQEFWHDAVRQFQVITPEMLSQSR